LVRKIIHIDMDAFYASIEQRDHPALRGKPVAVGGSKERGVVAAASYEARRFGVKSAMPSKMAYVCCPDLIFVQPRFAVYKEVSRQIRAVFHEFTDMVEPLSLDEAYLDVTQNKIGLPSATLIARSIKEKIKARTQLTASAGVSYNKFLAKTASDMDKPDGLYVITPDQGLAFVETLPIEKFYGIGKKTTEKMHRMGIFQGKDLRAYDEATLRHLFGKVGHYYSQICLGIDEREVKPNRKRKSLGNERTFDEDIFGADNQMERLMQIARQLHEDLQKTSVQARTLTLKLRYGDFHTITRSKTLFNQFFDEPLIRQVARELYSQVPEDERGIRLLGLSVSNFMEYREGIQLTLGF
jgi:DNA polymerase-4